jgi:hypothetical protein
MVLFGVQIKRALCYINFVGRSSGKKSAGTGKVFTGKEKLQPSKKTDITLLLRTPLVHIFLIAALGFLVYSNTFHSSFHWDDSPQIAQNPVIKSLENFTSNSKGYDFNPRRFIGYLTFALNYYVGGGSVTGYHIVNLSIHLINAFLVYFLVLLTFKTPYFTIGNGRGGLRFPDSRFTIHDSRSFIALFSALLFVLHPLQTEAVTYIVQRVASLSTLFYLLSIVFYIKGRLGAMGNNPPSSPLKLRGDRRGLRFSDSRLTIHGRQLGDMARC